MLHDVLRKLRKICEVDVLLTHQSFAFAHMPRGIRCGPGSHEQHGAEQTGGRVRIDVRDAAELLHDGIDKNCNGGERGQEKSAARRQQECQRADRDQEQYPESARNAAAGMQQQNQSKHIDCRLQDGLDARTRQALAYEDNAYETKT